MGLLLRKSNKPFVVYWVNRRRNFLEKLCKYAATIRHTTILLLKLSAEKLHAIGGLALDAQANTLSEWLPTQSADNCRVELRADVLCRSIGTAETTSEARLRIVEEVGRSVYPNTVGFCDCPVVVEFSPRRWDCLELKLRVDDVIFNVIKCQFKPARNANLVEYMR